MLSVISWCDGASPESEATQGTVADFRPNCAALLRIQSLSSHLADNVSGDSSDLQGVSLLFSVAGV